MKNGISNIEERLSNIEEQIKEIQIFIKQLHVNDSLQSEEQNQEIIELKGLKYRRVDRKAQHGDVVVFERTNKPEWVTVGKPYKAEEIEGELMFVDDDGDHCFVYGYITSHNFEDVIVYEPIQEITLNQLRKETIKKAKEFVENILGEYETFRITIGKYKNQNVRAVFRVNTNKRAVTALIYGAFSKELVFKGIAKCHPDDVFNEHIGKAIALGRALGLDVSEFENAPQPTIAVGQMVVSDIGTEYKVYSLENVVGNVKFRDSKGNLQDAIGGYLPDEKWYKIIDDTNAEYCDMCGKFTDDLVERKSGDLFCRECHKKYCEHLKCEEVLVSIDERVVYCLDCLQEVKGGI